MALMTPEQFAARAVGAQWRRWACGWDAMDCFGLLVLYFREVRGIDIGTVPQTDLASGFAALAQRWVQCEPEPGATAFMSFTDGAPEHCGVLLAGNALLHASGSHDERGQPFGSVRLTRLTAWRRVYPDTRFYRYSPQC